jgi:3',5'-cyclic AMP phosphodiesterase CpdA
VLIAHLSDLHIRDVADAVWLDRQLDRIVARAADHLVITGDLLDRWVPVLLNRVLDSLSAHALLDAERVTLLHGNHDLASSGGHPRRGADLSRLVGGFWDPPPVIAGRRREFYRIIERRGSGVGAAAPWHKTLRAGVTVAVVDTVPAFWTPIVLNRRTLVVRHGIGCIAPSNTAWLASLPRGLEPLIVLMHHYPLDAPPFRWTPDRINHPAMEALSWLESVEVRMEIEAPDRRRFWEAASEAGVRLVLCGHVHRARLSRHNETAVGLNGQSGAAWAGRTIAWYDIDSRGVRMELEQVQQ